MNKTFTNLVGESILKRSHFLSQSLICAIAISGITIGFCSQRSHAQSFDGVKYMVFFKGSCNQFLVGNASYECTSMVFASLQNGRATFNIPTANGALMLSGGKDSQLDSTRYTLLVDRVRYNDGTIHTEYSADGKCEMRVSADGVYVHEVKCQATNGVETIAIDFTGDGSPAERVSP
jgi:hypothetical protein